jgi:hypothetical protein
MKATKKQATARVFKKLSALRATLSNEERDILDNLIGVEEVTAHKLNLKAVDKAASKVNTKAAQVTAHKLNLKAADKAASKVNAKAAQVAAHKLNLKAADKAASKVNAKAAQVAAHKINMRAADKAASKTASKTSFRVAFDPTIEEYKIQD